jgi:hypothetical protein
MFKTSAFAKIFDACKDYAQKNDFADLCRKIINIKGKILKILMFNKFFRVRFGKKYEPNFFERTIFIQEKLYRFGGDRCRFVARITERAG